MFVTFFRNIVEGRRCTRKTRGVSTCSTEESEYRELNSIKRDDLISELEYMLPKTPQGLAIKRSHLCVVIFMYK